MVFVRCVCVCMWDHLTYPVKQYFPSCVLSIGRSSITSSSISSTRNLRGGGGGGREREREREILNHSAVPSESSMSAYKLLNMVSWCVWHYTTRPLCHFTITIQYNTMPLSVYHTIHNHTVPYLAVTTNLWSRSGHRYTTKELDILLALSTEAAVATLISPRYHLEASEERERE